MATKRIFIALFSLFLALVSFATNKNLEKDITMVSYEQSWSDMEGTLALKNNTNEEVTNLVFLIIYLDMQGNELDYKEFSKHVSIAPGMTKKLDIPAYEHDRYYYYYKSEGLQGRANASFKIKFQLKDYNLVKETDSGYDDGLIFIMSILTVLFTIGIAVGLYVLVAVLAQKRNRNVAIWILLSLFATPLLMIIILLCIGKDGNNTFEQHYEK